MIREFFIPLILLVVAFLLEVLRRQWKPSETGRFVLILLIGNLVVIALFLAWKTQERLSGVLKPASDEPMDPRRWGFARVNPPAGSFKVLLGNSLFVTSDPSHTVLRLAGQDMVRMDIQKRPWPFGPRMMVSARVFDKTGKIVGEIEGNRWSVNPNNYFKKQVRPHSITITDQYGSVFSAEFLNPDCVRILGAFHSAGRTVLALEDRLIFPGNNVMSRGYFAGSKTDILIE